MIQENSKKETRGGKREGSGRKKGEKRDIIAFKIDFDVKKEVKDLYGRSLGALFNTWIKDIIQEKKK